MATNTSTAGSATPRVAAPATTLVASVDEGTVFAVLLAISFSHMLNDTMQSLLPAIYPMLKRSFPSISGRSA